MKNNDVVMGIVEIIEMYENYLMYVKKVLEYRCKTRKPLFPEYISEHIIRYLLNKYDYGEYVRLTKGPGDIINLQNEYIIECKCFSSMSPITFGKQKWHQLMILDMIDGENMTLYRIDMNSDFFYWKLNGNRKRKRNRIIWENLYPIVKRYTEIVYQGSIYDLIDVNESQ